MKILLPNAALGLESLKQFTLTRFQPAACCSGYGNTLHMNSPEQALAADQRRIISGKPPADTPCAEFARWPGGHLLLEDIPALAKPRFRHMCWRAGGNARSSVSSACEIPPPTMLPGRHRRRTHRSAARRPTIQSSPQRYFAFLQLDSRAEPNQPLLRQKPERIAGKPLEERQLTQVASATLSAAVSSSPEPARQIGTYPLPGSP